MSLVLNLKDKTAVLSFEGTKVSFDLLQGDFFDAGDYWHGFQIGNRTYDLHITCDFDEGTDLMLEESIKASLFTVENLDLTAKFLQKLDLAKEAE